MGPSKLSVYPGRNVVAYLSFPGKPEDDTVLKVNEQEVHLLAERLQNGQQLHRLAARCRILELERLNASGSHDAEIKELAEKNGLASSQTSFIAVEKEEGESNDCEEKKSKKYKKSKGKRRAAGRHHLKKI